LKSTATYYLGKNSQSFEQHWKRAQELGREWESSQFELALKTGGTAAKCFLLTKKTETTRKLDWVDLFNVMLEQGGEESKIEYPFGSRVHALFGISYDKHTFFISYGSGHSIAKRLRILTRFGRVVAGNSKEGKSTTRQLKTFMHQFGGKEMEVTIARGDDTAAFRSGEEMQTLRSVATTNEFRKPLIARGGSGYNFWTPDSIGDLTVILSKLLEWWNKGEHKDEVLAQLERFTEVDDEDELKLCRDKLISVIEGDDYSDISTIMPSEYWNAVGFQYLPKRKKREKALDIVPYDPLALASALKQWLADGHQLDDLNIQVHVADTTHMELCPAINFMTWSFTDEIQKKTYIWDEGSWFSMDADWASDTLKDAKVLFEAELKGRSAFGLPIWSSSPKIIAGKELKGEDLFVHDCGLSTLAPSAVCLHRVLPPSPTTQVELCDVFWRGQHLLFCKHGSSFSPVHEVCGQAVHAIKAIMYDRGFLHWGEKQLRDAGHNIKLRKDASSLGVGIVLALNSPDRPISTWSFRSLSCLMNTVREIGTYNYKVDLYLVHYRAETPKSYSGAQNKKKLKRKKFWKPPQPRTSK